MKKLNFIFIVLVSFFLNSQTINEISVKKHLYTLANDSMQGRKAGSPGIEKAAKYIEQQFSEIGLKPFNNSNFRQSFKHINRRSEKKEELDLFNIIGLLEGTSLREEFVIISAHYDHLGQIEGGKGDLVFNGANDNATGVAAMIMLAEYFKKAQINKRSVLFVAFTAEEMGLVGSNYFGKTISAESIIAGVNIEMIGKESPFGPKTAWLTGFKRSTFGKIIQKNLSSSEYRLYPDPYKDFRLFFRSDNASLARFGVPAHTFSTSPMDKDLDYHQLSDEVETLDVTIITETIKAISVGIKSIVSGDDTPSRVVL
ncbi:M20/M25/M40 family metallo-hydrolase [Flavobacteriaceae bacterium]|nr:M20/M25/M40 family metallo-hydrolase [Flavobacteriaceae bacterium]MDC0117140.1 M20/M25/M40 family metallo-hydrolase [Flavobacteriaceae bacterium]